MTKKKTRLTNPKQVEYWQKRIIIRDKKYVADVNKIEKELKKQFVKSKKEIKKEIDAFYLNLPENTLTEGEKDRLEEVINAINRELDRLFQKEEDLLTNAMIAKYEEAYGTASKELNAILKTSFSEVPTRFVKEAISQNWSGTSFSKRIWENHRYELAKAIKQELTAGLIRGSSIQDITRNINKKFKKGEYNAFRLVRTEMSWVQNQATLDNYKDNKIEYYQFMAFIDHRTSEVCKSRDGEIIAVKDGRAGSSLPPLHPNCRSCIIPLTNREAK